MRKAICIILEIIIFLLLVYLGFYIDCRFKQLSTLTRSHAVMWERQEMLKQITCGYCHRKVPDWCDKHDGGE